MIPVTREVLIPSWMGRSLKSCSVFYLPLYHLLSNQVAFTSNRLADRLSPGRPALLEPWTANGRLVQMDWSRLFWLLEESTEVHQWCSDYTAVPSAWQPSCVNTHEAAICRYRWNFLLVLSRILSAVVRREGVFNLNDKTSKPQGKNVRRLWSESLWTRVLSVKLILMDDDSLPILPTTTQIQHSAMGSKRAVTLTWPSPWQAAEVETTNCTLLLTPCQFCRFPRHWLIESSSKVVGE